MTGCIPDPGDFTQTLRGEVQLEEVDVFPAWNETFQISTRNAAFGGWLISESLGHPMIPNHAEKGELFDSKPWNSIPKNRKFVLFWVKWVHRLEWFTHNYTVSFVGSHCSKHPLRRRFMSLWLPRRVDSDESLSGRKKHFRLQNFHSTKKQGRKNLKRPSLRFLSCQHLSYVTPPPKAWSMVA